MAWQVFLLAPEWAFWADEDCGADSALSPLQVCLGGTPAAQPGAPQLSQHFDEQQCWHFGARQAHLGGQRSSSSGGVWLACCLCLPVLG